MEISDGYLGGAIGQPIRLEVTVLQVKKNIIIAFMFLIFLPVLYDCREIKLFIF